MNRDVNKFRNLVIDLESIGDKRKRGCCTQFMAIFKRNSQFIVRNPKTMTGIFVNGVIAALLSLALYWKVGEISDEQLADPAFRGRFIANMLGLSFMLTNTISSSSSYAAIHPMPNEVPVFRRETANKMYSPSAYFFGRFWSNTLI